MKVWGFVGPSGTGKSHRALEIASRHGIDSIIDDGLLIKGGRVLAGVSAKREPTKMASVRRAMFMDETHAAAVREAIRNSKAGSVLILGTSARMADGIAMALGLPELSRYILITEVASPAEIESALNMRMAQGMHVIPAPTLAIKSQFSGYFLDPLLDPIKRLARKGLRAGQAARAGYGQLRGQTTAQGQPAGASQAQPKGQAAPQAQPKGQAAPQAQPKGQPAPQAQPKGQPVPQAQPKGQSAPVAQPKSQAAPQAHAIEGRTVVRPTYSYMGGYTISKQAVEQIAAIAASMADGVIKVIEARVSEESVGLGGKGVNADISLAVRYGARIHRVLEDAAARVRAEIGRQTALNVLGVSVSAKALDR